MFDTKEYKPLDITTDIIYEQFLKMRELDYTYSEVIEHISTVNFLTWLTREIEAKYCFSPDETDLSEKLQLMCQFKSVKNMFSHLQ